MVTVDRILELVHESGLTAKEFAVRSGLAGGSITDWKTGRSRPSVESLQKIAKYANVNLEWLTGDSKYKTEQDYVNNYLKNQTRMVILKTIERYYYEYVVPCSLTEKDINYLVESIVALSSENVDEIGQKIISFGEKFNNKKKKLFIDLIHVILKEIMHDLESKNTYAYINNMITKNSKNADKLIAKFCNIPVLGKIAAGQPILANEYIEGYLPVDPSIYGMKLTDDLFYLRVSGESMNLKIHNGDYALIHKQDYAENGDIIVAIVNSDDEATLKKYKRINDELVMLEPMSSYPMEPLVIDLKKTKFEIVGKAIGHFGKF